MAANSRMAMATHIMAALGLHPDETLSSTYLASSVNTNPVVVRRLLGDLQKAGLVETCPGKNGGARLSRKPSNINLYEIFSAVDEEEVFALNPNDPNQHCPLSCVMSRVLEPVFRSAGEALARDLKKIRLSEIVEKARSP